MKSPNMKSIHGDTAHIFRADVEITAKLINLIDNEYIGYKSKLTLKYIAKSGYNEEIPANLGLKHL